jgi:hypothetical protein
LNSRIRILPRWRVRAKVTDSRRAIPTSCAARSPRLLPVDGPAIVDCVVAANEMPNVPHVELGLAYNYAVAKVKEAVISVTGR